MRHWLAILAMIPGPAMAEAPYDGFMGGISGCVEAAGGGEAARACVGTGASACFEGAPDGQTTVGMMFCLLAEAEAWDALLNAEYGRARRAAARADRAENQPDFARRAEQLLTAERAWIAFRDANCAAEYGAWGGGSMRQIAGADCRLRMTAERTLELRAYRRTLGDE